MIAGVYFRPIHQTINSLIPKILSVTSIQNIMSHRMHYICGSQQLNCMPSGFPNSSNLKFLQPVLPMYNSACGLKLKGVLQLRCKDCYFLTKHERLYVMCKTHPRHKQAQMKKREYKTWILTSASQSKIRGW